MPEILRPWIVGHTVDYDVVVDEDIQLVFEGEVLHDFVVVDAECAVRPCNYDAGEFNWGYSKEVGIEYKVSTGVTWSVAAEVAILCLAKINVGPEFVLTLQYTRNTKETESIGLNIPIDLCFDKRREVWKSIGISTGWRDVVSQRYIWEIDDAAGGGTLTTDYGLKRITGDADKVGGWHVIPTSTECENYPDCGAPC